MTDESMSGAVHRLGVDWERRLLELLDEQLMLYERLDELSRRQSELIEQEETDRLLSLLGERQDVIDRIEAVDASMRPFRDQWDRLVGPLPESRRVVIRERLDRLTVLVGEIAGRDEADRRRLEQRRDAVGDELAGLSRGAGALSAYGGGGQGRGPRFQDTEG